MVIWSLLTIYIILSVYVYMHILSGVRRFLLISLASLPYSRLTYFLFRLFDFSFVALPTQQLRLTELDQSKKEKEIAAASNGDNRDPASFNFQSAPLHRVQAAAPSERPLSPRNIDINESSSTAKASASLGAVLYPNQFRYGEYWPRGYTPLYSAEEFNSAAEHNMRVASVYAARASGTSQIAELDSSKVQSEYNGASSASTPSF